MNIVELETGVALLEPEQVADIVQALFAVSYAIEQLGLIDVVNKYRHQESGTGAYDLAYCMLANVNAVGEACESAPEA